MSYKPDSLTSSAQTKNGKIYAVISYTIDGERKIKWKTLHLDEGTAIAKVNKELRKVTNQFEQELQAGLAQGTGTAAGTPVYDYLASWLECRKSKIQINTYTSYRSMIERKVKAYFTARPSITVGDITKQDIMAFYKTLYDGGDKGSSVLHYHAMLHCAFKQAYMDEMIPANPFDKIERPRKDRFNGNYYSETEWKNLLHLAKPDDIYPAIILAAGLGLRRSEALGARWSRINWEERTILLDTKIVEYKDNTGKTMIEAVEEMKNKSSRRTLPMPDIVYETLLEIKARQDLYRSMFRGSYDRKYDDYICVDKLGGILSPSYVTRHFGELLNKLGLRHIRFHDLRHTFASLLINKDTPMHKVSDFLGHSDISTTANIYAHLDKASKKDSADLIDSIFTSEQKESEAV